MSSTDTTWDPTLIGTVTRDSTNTSFPPTFVWKGIEWPIIMGADDSGDGDDTSGGTDDATSGDDKGDDDKGGDDKTFTQDQLNAIVTRETQKAARGKLDPKELGFESAKDMKEWVDSQRQDADAKKTEDEKAREAEIAAAKKEATDSVLSSANERIRRAEFLLAAVDHNVRKEAREDAYLLGPTLETWAEVAISDDGKVSGFDDAFFEELKEKKPYLFEAEGSSTGNGRGDIGAGRRGDGNGKPTREEELKQKYRALQ